MVAPQNSELACLPKTMQQLQVERSITIPGVHVDIRRMVWDSVHEADFQPTSHYFDYALSPRMGAPTFFDRTQNRYNRLGKVIFLPKDSVFSVRSTRGTYHNLCLTIHDAAALCEMANEPFDDIASPCFDVRAPQVTYGLARLAEEIRNPGFAHEALLESIALMLLIDFGRYLKATQDYSGDPLPKWRLDRIREIVEDRNEYSTSIASIARECGLSSRHLMRTFKATTGTTLHDYIATSRLNFAKRELRKGTMIKLVASNCGFRSAASFSASFRRSTGLTPKQYRSRLGSGEELAD